TGLEEHDVVVWRCVRRPAERLVEAARAAEVRHPERYEAHPLLHLGHARIAFRRVARDRLIDRFVRLCEIPSPTGAEREIADAIVVAALTYHHLVASFEGVEAHAGIAPEEGRSAIAAACAAVAAMQLGRLDAGTTANVGRIEGGTAANVVPGRCRVEGEARGI